MWLVLTLALREGSRNTDCDYSAAYVSLYTDSNLVGHGMTFTIGRGNDIVSVARRGCGGPCGKKRAHTRLLVCFALLGLPGDQGGG